MDTEFGGGEGNGVFVGDGGVDAGGLLPCDCAAIATWSVYDWQEIKTKITNGQ